MARLVFRVSATLPVSTEFNCKNCGYLGFAQVMVPAEGSAPAASHQDEQAKAQANAMMRASADTLGKKIISLAKCPRCQRADIEAHNASAKAVARGTTIGVAWLLGGLVLLAIATEAGKVAGLPGVILGAIGLIFVVDARKTAKLARENALTVQFLS